MNNVQIRFPLFHDYYEIYLNKKPATGRNYPELLWVKSPFAFNKFSELSDAHCQLLALWKYYSVNLPKFPDGNLVNVPLFFSPKEFLMIKRVKNTTKNYLTVYILITFLISLYMRGTLIGSISWWLWFVPLLIIEYAISKIAYYAVSLRKDLVSYSSNSFWGLIFNILFDRRSKLNRKYTIDISPF